MRFYRLILVLICTSGLLSIIACSRQEDISQDKAELTELEIEQVSQIDAGNESDEEAKSEGFEEASETIVKDGLYVSTLSFSNEGDFLGDDYGSLKSARLENGHFIVDGTFRYYYDANPSSEEYEILDRSRHVFKVSDDTVYQSVGGLSEAQIHDSGEFNELIEGVKDSGLGLLILIENGIVKEISISS